MIRIAIVEDDPNYIQQLRDYLAQYGRESGESLEVSGMWPGNTAGR